MAVVGCGKKKSVGSPTLEVQGIEPRNQRFFFFASFALTDIKRVCFSCLGEKQSQYETDTYLYAILDKGWICGISWRGYVRSASLESAGHTSRLVTFSPLRWEDKGPKLLS